MRLIALPPAQGLTAHSPHSLQVSRTVTCLQHNQDLFLEVLVGSFLSHFSSVQSSSQLECG